jgi:hypothetical protein
MPPDRGDRDVATRPGAAPLATFEVRWFLEGGIREHRALRAWFETTDPFKRGPRVGAPTWQGRLDDEPDVYLLVPGAADIGIKWREGQLQVKGRLADQGVRAFGPHRGRLEQWVKWSYADLPEPYRHLFTGSPELGVRTVAVAKTRAQRKIALGTSASDATEVEAAAFVERGLNAELADLSVSGRAWCSVAFEAFPCDPVTAAAFAPVVTAFLRGLTPLLDGARSESYPGWLRRAAV